MDFNTGESGGSEDRPLFGGEAGRRAGGPAPGPARSPGGEFNLQDPVNSFVSTVRTLVLNPVGFFREIPRRGNFVNPLVFAIICALINGLIGGIIAFFISLGSRTQGFGGAFVGLIGSIIFTPVGVVIGLFIGAGILHLLVMLLVRPNAGFEATFRVGAYASVTQLVSWLSVVPILGILVGLVVGLYGLFLGIVGIREVHSTTTGRAALVVLIPIAVIFLLVLLLGVTLVALFFGSQQQFR